MAEHASVKGRKRTMYYERGKPNPKTYGSAKQKNYQNHHILPCTSVKTSLFTAADKKDNLIKAVQYFTNWNIHKPDNLKELPTPKAFQKKYGVRGGKKDDQPTLCNLPCHQNNWGHTKYNKDVGASLKKVWGDVSIELDEHKLTNATDVGGELDGKRSDWQTKLTAGRDCSHKNWRSMCQGTKGVHNNFCMVPLPSSPI